MKIAHVVNPVKFKPASELYVAQPISFESIRVAKEFAQGKTQVELFAIGYEEDAEIIPSFFTQLPNLNRSVLDLGKFSNPKKYPLLNDVFRALYNATDAEYFIYTNIDIALMPQFYIAVSEILKQGHDALLVNRRGISTHYKTAEELPLMYSDFGKPHPGFDCFVFKRQLLDKIILENICLGVSFSEVTVVHNFIAFAKNLKLVDELHLTFHIGTEIMPPLDQEYYWHNRNEYEQKIYPRIKHLLSIEKFPYSHLPFYKRILKWILNPNFRTKQVLELEGKSLSRRLKHKIDSLRFSLLDKIK